MGHRSASDGVSFFTGDRLGFRRATASMGAPSAPSPTAMFLEALERLREERRSQHEIEMERRREHARERSIGLSREAWRLLAVLRVLEGGALLEDVRAGFAAIAATGESFDRALAELAQAGLLEAGPAIGPDGRPAPRGMLALRYDVDLPEDP